LTDKPFLKTIAEFEFSMFFLAVQFVFLQNTKNIIYDFQSKTIILRNVGIK